MCGCVRAVAERVSHQESFSVEEIDLSRYQGRFATTADVLAGATGVYAIPPVTALPPGQAVRAALQAAYGAGAACFIYFSSCGLYGAGPDDDVWVDEDTPVVHDDPAMSEKFLRTIERNADRLARLIDDLLTISELESGRVKLDLRPVEAPLLVTEVLETFAPRAAAKRVRLINEMPALTVSADKDRFKVRVSFHLMLYEYIRHSFTLPLD